MPWISPSDQIRRVNNARMAGYMPVGERQYQGNEYANPTLNYLIVRRQQQEDERRRFGNVIH